MTGRSDRRATGERQEGGRQKVGWRQETTGSDRKRQDSDRRAAGKRQGSDRGATGERQGSDREATGKLQGSDRGPKCQKSYMEAKGRRQDGDRGARRPESNKGMGFTFSKTERAPSPVVAELPKCATCPSSLEHAVSLLQECSLVGDIDPRHIVSVLSDYGLDDFISARIKEMGYWGICAWMHTRMLRPDVGPLSPRFYAVVLAALFRLAEPGIDHRLIFLKQEFQVDYKAGIAVVDSLMVDHTSSWEGPETRYKPRFPYSGVLLQAQRKMQKYNDVASAMDESQKSEVAADVARKMGWAPKPASTITEGYRHSVYGLRL